MSDILSSNIYAVSVWNIFVLYLIVIVIVIVI